jgi:predicted dehydrogenase
VPISCLVTTVNILIVGGGSIAVRHISNIRRLKPNAKVTLWHLSSTTPVSQRLAIDNMVDRVVYSLQSALNAKPAAAIISCPTSLHTKYSSLLAQKGISILVEKPLSNSLAELDQLGEMVRENQLTFMVGYNFRFYQPLRDLRGVIDSGLIGSIISVRAEVGEYLPDWRTYDYRKSTSAQEKLGGGVVFELSHELDYISWLFGDPKKVFARTRKLSDLEIDVEDTADILIETKKDIVATLHLNMVQKKKTRSCTVIGSEGIIRWDGVSHEVSCSSWNRSDPMNYAEDLTFDPGNMYLRELQEFFYCIDNSTPPPVDFISGRRIVELALAIKESNRTQKPVCL